MRNIFLEKSYTKCGGETILIIVCQDEDYQNIFKLSCRSFAFTSYKALLKIKKGSGATIMFAIF